MNITSNVICSTKINEKQYYDRMDQSLGDKRTILSLIDPSSSSILDYGAGTGKLSAELSRLYKNAMITAFDSSLQSIEMLKEIKSTRKNFEIIPIEMIHRNPGSILSIDFFKTFNPGRFDTIIFSSVLHEIYSLERYRGKLFNPDSVIDTLAAAINVLTPTGQIIIRDGIKPLMTDIVNVRIKDEDFSKRCNCFLEVFQGHYIPFSIKRISEKEFIYKMKYSDAMEMLYTCTWGEQSFPREVKEQYGYFNCREWAQAIDMIQKRLVSQKDRIYMKHFREYFQEDYKTHLQFVTIYSETNPNYPLPFPNTNSIIVIQKF